MVSSIKQSLGSPLKELLSTLKTKVYENFINNPSLVYIKATDYTLRDPACNIDFNVKLIKSLGSKPQSTKEHFEVHPQSDAEAATKKEFNPFLPPFEEGQFISDILEYHRLIYNKYSVCDNHVLVITKEF